MSDAVAATPAPSRGGWFAMIIIGSILTLIATPMLFGAAFLFGAVAPSTAEGFVTSPAVRVSTPATAVTGGPLQVETSLDRDDFPGVRVSLEAGTEGEAPVFIGVGPAAEVDQYLTGVRVGQISGLRSDPLTVQVRETGGSAQPQPPAEQTFWVASDSGPTARLDWVVQPGDWTVVMMNADATAGVTTTARVGVEAPWAPPLAGTLLAIAIVQVVIGLALIIVGAFGWGRARPPVTPLATGPYPVAVVGELRETPSRGLWLVKWILAIPHWIVLSLLWLAFVVVTVVAGFAILFTGRYPRSLFEFTVGVLRWSWRVSFYAYSALATDQYPPFSLSRTDYPADFDVEYPERLSHGLVLVKSWLLAIPHLLVVGVLVGSTTWGLSSTMSFAGASGSVSLLGLLVLVAAVILLFGGRYQRPLFDLIMGLNRWALRVAAYVSLMRDEYPPFRLDQGATEPPADAIAAGGAAVEKPAVEKPEKPAAKPAS